MGLVTSHSCNLFRGYADVFRTSKITFYLIFHRNSGASVQQRNCGQNVHLIVNCDLGKHNQWLPYRLVWFINLSRWRMSLVLYDYPVKQVYYYFHLTYTVPRALVALSLCVTSQHNDEMDE